MLDDAEKTCDRVWILNTKLMAIGTPEELRESLFRRNTIIKLERVDIIQHLVGESAQVPSPSVVIATKSRDFR